MLEQGPGKTCDPKERGAGAGLLAGPTMDQTVPVEMHPMRGTRAGDGTACEESSL